MSVTVGVHVHAEVSRLRATLDAVLRPGGGTPDSIDVVLLPDGPDAAVRQALTALDLPRSGTDEPRGPPACFNRLASSSASEVVILLESGAVPAPGALDRLAEVLLDGEDRGGVGLAGPSTNSAWNEQGAFPGRGGAPGEVVRAGREAVARFGEQVRSLAPLHSLSDFCFAVHRRVITAIGGADEDYGPGPCWEMEYSARAARAGFSGVWVGGAYVWRAPFTARRQLEEVRRFEASRRRYQDSLCALRLRGESDDYEPHCRGEDCPHFAPRELIALRRPLVPSRPASSAQPACSAGPASSRDDGRPLVSCIMPTRDRAEFALQAVRLFQRQDYPARELIIVDDGQDDLAGRLPLDSRIRHVGAPAGESIGAKRNRACAEARGAFIAHWDDDDWYGTDRLSAQLAPLIAGHADVTGLRMPVVLELDAWRFWTLSESLHRRMFVKDVHGGTLAFGRHVWERLARYPATSLAEDAAFLARAAARGARLQAVDGAERFVYVRHGANAWRFSCGGFVDPTGWRPAAEPPFSPEDRTFYGARSAARPAPLVTPAAPRTSAALSPEPPSGKPLVSCIMPTADRRPFISRAIAFFQRQEYENRELVILDDGADRIADLVPSDDPRIRYVPLDRRLVLGEKRNRACELARGEIIVHWDDDDWQAPHRLRYQVDELEAHGAAVCGPGQALYLDPAAGRAWLYRYANGSRPWLAGNALCYRRSLWRENRFEAVGVGEDTRFVWSSAAQRPLVLADHRFFVAVIHSRNSNRKATAGPYWRSRPLGEIRSLLASDWELYASVSAPSPTPARAS